MDQAVALDLAKQAMQVGIMVSLPILAVSLFIGILVSVFQAITSVQEMTLTFVPKLVALGLVVMLLGNWMLTEMVGFVHVCFDHVARVTQ